MWRRLAVGPTAVGVTAGLIGLAWHMFAANGWSVWEVLTFLCFFLFAPWLGLAATA